jgi:hypothetical protein
MSAETMTTLLHIMNVGYSLNVNEHAVLTTLLHLSISHTQHTCYMPNLKTATHFGC